jgi:glycosyltransferase involved in cell wall biosynthesis
MASDRRYNFVVSTIVPAKDEEGNIDQFCTLYAQMLAGAPFDGEVVFVDDGSTDGTLAKIKANAAKYPFVKYRSHQRNRGLTEALQTGFAAASGDVFVFYPADLQYMPEDIPSLVAPIADGADICTGWKQGKYTKRFVSRVYNGLSRRIFGLKVHDLNSVKAFRRQVVDEIFLREDWHRYLVPLAVNEGFRVDEVKIPLYARNWGQTKFSIWRIPVGVLDMLAVKFQISFLRKPLLYFGGAGVLCFFLGILVGLWSLYERFVLGQGNRLWLFLILLLIGLGMGLFLMGFMAEGQTALKEEVSDMRRKTQMLVNQMKRRDADHK